MHIIKAIKAIKADSGSNEYLSWLGKYGLVTILTGPNHIIQFLNQNPNYRLNPHKIYMLRSLTLCITLRIAILISTFR